ncbi:hypothetical protein [Acinetobacter sp. ANC 4173]|uniref:hypothetical protein n=1 Tax=Acinetobacter sp. ANC 4173 TaxID=2529837 RepID=UPI001D0DBE87|nr:hypothetical protein [Acinetobacter sp. ANC 4173]
MNKLLISFFLISGAFIAQQSFADTEFFKVYKQCHDEMEWSCDVIREVNGEKILFIKK